MSPSKSTNEPTAKRPRRSASAEDATSKQKKTEDILKKVRLLRLDCILRARLNGRGNCEHSGNRIR